MNTIESTQATTARPSFEYITEFREKNTFETEINNAWRRDESECVQNLIAQTEIDHELSEKIYDLAFNLAHTLRDRKSSSGKAGIVQGLLQEFALSSQEGIALMCLAEALLRIPDNATRDLLIKDKINQGNWKEHLGQSNLMFVNAAAWGLMLTGKLMETPKQQNLSSILSSILARSGRGIIRKAVDVAMRMMGEQFVTGESIEEALEHAEVLEKKGFRYSYDMLGEAALTEHDAERYLEDYTQAIHAIGKASKDKDVYAGPGISIKLSALHPRYQRSQIARVHAELYPKILDLAILAKSYDIGLNIDAEEADRLEISLELLERLCFEPALANWKGIGFVIQAYQKRCFYVVDYIVDLAKRSNKRLMIRLVKGAYWDSEIKKAQIDGMDDYPVFTRKVHTDLSYIACAKKLLAEPDFIYPQFATHNAQTLATIYNLANPEKYYVGQYEFQCLHGMGEPLYEQVVGPKSESKLNVPCRIYAPVGNHETLLAYLVRRLLENGANTSFVNRIADKTLKIDDLIEDPIHEINKMAKITGSVGLMHPAIALPKDLLRPIRENSKGIDLADDSALFILNSKVKDMANQQWLCQPIVKTQLALTANSENIINPANHLDIVGTVVEASSEQVDQALKDASQAHHSWQAVSAQERAAMLFKAADIMQSRIQALMILLSRESGKTYSNGIAEVREAIDFLRYYASQAASLSSPKALQPLGTVLCISPWNFPLAIFAGQISAALAVGNCVIAKPAEQTPLIASVAVNILLEAGVPNSALQLLPGRGETVGAQLSSDPRIDGIMFTGSTEVAKILHKTVSQRLSASGLAIPLIAETGGQNAMIVDSSALTEQVVVDAVNSAFDSAGQRCSALRVLCVQKDNADVLIQMLKGAMSQLNMGNPQYLATDVGPVIDAEAQQNIQKHIETMRAKGYLVHQLRLNKNSNISNATFIAPTLIELPNLDDLKREVFGPVLHLITYKHGELDQLLEQINQKGYGLTMGLHTRIDETIQTVIAKAHVGNLYINRNIVGAVVGVQPFGGEGLSGTGPKAGGPLYLYKLMQPNTLEFKHPFGTLNNLTDKLSLANPHSSIYTLFQDWAKTNFPHITLENVYSPVGVYELPGPTGESNQYSVLPRQQVLCIAETDAQYLAQINTILALGSQPTVLADNAFILRHLNSMPEKLRQRFHIVADLNNGQFEAIFHHGSQPGLIQLQDRIAKRQGAIVAIHHFAEQQSQLPTETILIERALSVNTAAAGGNASLMTLDG